jgi:hypothetical protein
MESLAIIETRFRKRFDWWRHAKTLKMSLRHCLSQTVRCEMGMVITFGFPYCSWATPFMSSSTGTFGALIDGCRQLFEAMKSEIDSHSESTS